MSYTITKYDGKAPLHKDAPNFKQYEVGKSVTADRLRVDNSPSLEVLSNAAALAVNCLQPIRNQFGGYSCNSWYRSESLEKVIAHQGYLDWCKKRSLSVNDATWKKYFALKSHPLGQAADIEIVGVSNDVLFDWCKKNLKFDQLIREFAKKGDPMSGWVHISWNEKGNRQQVLHIG